MNEQIMVSGTITRSTYESLKHCLISPTFRFGMLALVTVYDLIMLWQVFMAGAYANLVLVAAFTGVMAFVFINNANGAVKRAVNGNEILRRGDPIEMTIHFEDSGVRMFNHTMGRERSVRYGEIQAYASTERCIALFLRTRTYLMVPKDNMDDAMEECIMALLQTKCPKLRKRM